jgi:branched-chain amino acid transport system permease protein
VTVLDGGKVIAEGTPDEVKRHPKVVEAYLGQPPQTDITGDASPQPA